MMFSAAAISRVTKNSGRHRNRRNVRKPMSWLITPVQKWQSAATASVSILMCRVALTAIPSTTPFWYRHRCLKPHSLKIRRLGNRAVSMWTRTHRKSLSLSRARNIPVMTAQRRYPITPKSSMTFPKPLQRTGRKPQSRSQCVSLCPQWLTQAPFRFSRWRIWSCLPIMTADSRPSLSAQA